MSGERSGLKGPTPRGITIQPLVHAMPNPPRDKIAVGVPRRWSMAIALTGGVLGIGCVQMHPTRSGYLSNYGGLERVESKFRVIGKGDARLVRWADACDLRGIDSFVIEPVVWLADDLGQPASSPERGESIRRAFHEALAEELGEIRPIVGATGPRTAVVRAAVTGIQEAKPIVNLATMLLSGPLFNGGAVVEVEILAPDGSQLAAESVAIQGRDWHVFGFFHRHRHAERSARHAASVIADDLLRTEQDVSHDIPRGTGTSCTSGDSIKNSVKEIED